MTCGVKQSSCVCGLYGRSGEDLSQRRVFLLEARFREGDCFRDPLFTPLDVRLAVVFAAAREVRRFAGVRDGVTVSAISCTEGS
jgi:hypothetical protein